MVIPVNISLRVACKSHIEHVNVRIMKKTFTEMTDKSVVLLDVGGTFVKGGLADSTGELADGLTWQVPIRSDGSRKEILESL